MIDNETHSQHRSVAGSGLGRRLATAGFLFFLAKGIVWLVLAGIVGLSGHTALTGG